MTDETIRIALAGFMGYTSIGRSVNAMESGLHGYLPNQAWPPVAFPNYPADLNAIREVEERLSRVQRAEYARVLTSIAWESEQPIFGPLHATARQKAEALLRALGKWEGAS